MKQTDDLGPPPPAYELPPIDSFFPQPEYRPDAPLYFVHVPKCAGTTIRTNLESAYEGARVFPSGSPFTGGHYYGYSKFKSTGETLSHYDLVSSHYSTLAFDALRPDTNMFIWLREPRDCMLSSFFFFVIQTARRNKNAHFARIEAGERLETVFMDWLRAPPGTTRYQLDIVGGRLGPSYDHWLQQNPGRDVTEHAISLLRRCFFIGLIEDNERSRDGLAAITGILPPRLSVQRNKGTRRETRLSLSPEEQREFDALLAPDDRFYDMVRAIYRRQMDELAARAGQHPAFGLIGNRDELRRHLMHQPGALAQRELSTWHTWDKGHEDNLDNRESHTAADGTVRRWRWTGPGQDTHLYFRFPRAPGQLLTITITVNAATPRRNVAAATVRLSGRPILLKLTEVPGVGYHLRARLSRSVLRSLPDIVDIHIHTPNMLDEGEDSDVGDPRRLGIALESVAIEPLTAANSHDLGGWLTRIRRRLGLA